VGRARRHQKSGMTKHAPGLDAGEDRFTRARLKLVVETLPSTIVLNPLWTTVLFLPFLLTNGFFGHIAPWHLGVVLALHVAMSLWALLIYRRYRAGMLDTAALERRLIALQFAISVTWSAVVWLFHDPGNAVNNVYVAMIFVTVIWAVVFTRASHVAVFVAGFVPLTASYTVLLFTAPGEVASVFSKLIPLWTVYIVVMGLRGRESIDRSLKVQFANEDLSAALRISNDEALRKRGEAEAANAAKTTFLANMSHELRTPLNAILGFSDIIAGQALGSAATARYIEYARDIHDSGAHLLSLINDLLDIAKIEAGKMEIDARPVDPVRVVLDVERVMAARLRKQSLTHVIEPDLPLVVADERALKQILFNLLSNAIKFTPEGGAIEVRCHRGADGGLLLQVSDTGPGIAPEKRERVFQAFTQIDNRYGRAAGGTGLGLALVRGMAELHGGKAWIEDAPGHGTTVCVYLPLAIEPRAGAAFAIG
jgi:two-component system cell cycle sensor histidine kinase PleC